MCNNFDPVVTGPICCHFNNPFTDKKRICCDITSCGSCCRRFDEERRDCFWPDFTHPRFLCCRILYGCDPNICNDPCDAIDPDEGRRRRRCGCRC